MKIQKMSINKAQLLFLVLVTFVACLQCTSNDYVFSVKGNNTYLNDKEILVAGFRYSNALYSRNVFMDIDNEGMAKREQGFDPVEMVRAAKAIDPSFYMEKTKQHFENGWGYMCASTRLQCVPHHGPNADPGGDGSKEEPGIRWWLEALKDMRGAYVTDSNLPDPLITLDGKKVTSPDIWNRVRRPEILYMLEQELYGRAPGAPEKMVSRVVYINTTAKVTFKQVEIDLFQGENMMTMDVLICLPANAKEPVPVFLGMNFMGNHTINSDPGIMISQKILDTPGIDKDSLERTRGSMSSRWPVEMVTDRGYGIVTLSRTGGQKLFPKEREASDWGAISAWAWALRRVVDYLETDGQVDHERIASVGTSRLGKVALWAGATDERISMVIPMCSGGCGGASLMSKRFYGEASDELTGGIGPDKVAGNFLKYLKNEAILPFDQHMAISLIAPRPIYIGTAEGQKEPQNLGMYLALKHAEPVYQLLGTEGFGANTMPGIHQPVMTRMGFHIRQGKHGIETYDWKCFMDFADKHLNRKHHQKTQ